MQWNYSSLPTGLTQFDIRDVLGFAGGGGFLGGIVIEARLEMRMDFGFWGDHRVCIVTTARRLGLWFEYRWKAEDAVRVFSTVHSSPVLWIM